MATAASLLRNDESKELRIVLLGGRWGGKSSAGNTILGEERFESGRQRTAKSDNRHATVAGRKLILVDTPGWKGHLSLRETTEADRREIKRSVCECPPGPHVFLLVVPVDSAFTEEHRRSLVDHLTLLGDKVWRYSMVLFTCGDWLREKSIEEHIETEGDALQWLTDKCRNRFHILNNKNREDPTQVSQLLDKIEEMVAENNGGHFEVDESTRQMMLTKKTEVEAKATERKMQTDKRREELSRLLQGAKQPTELRVVLLGSRNAGKSATGNTILGSEEFDIKKGTSKTVVKRASVEGTPITIVDTPGWWQGFSVRDTTKQGKQELTRSASLCPPGPHVFLLVIDTDVAFTERQREAVEEHLQLISGRVWNRTMILFSRADWLGAKSIEQHIEEEGKALQWLVEKCGNWYHALDNKNKDNKAQVAELLQKMKEMVAGNGGSFHEVDGRALQSIEEDRKAVEERAKWRMTKAKEQRKRFQGTNIHLPEMKVVLMGQKSSGKNAVGTTILDRNAFPSCETACCEIEEGVVFGRRLTVVNTPGWWDNLARCTLERDKEIMRGLSLCLPGPHAVLLVIPVDMAYTERHRRALQDHLCCLGEDVWRHTIVLFTFGDRLGETSVEQHIEREGWPLQWVVEKCGNRYQLFNNKNRGDGAQVAELLEKMEEMVAGNDGEQFSPDMSQVYREVENMLKRKVAEEMKVASENEGGKD
ncbi:GTPase IMAP family member 8-like [Anguilla rostrata]|uniref:GTPase IMAP family member 8-like n=1 Tax=Anguilla rostrata TaxID=7938 RepID=UPI0030D05313